MPTGYTSVVCERDISFNEFTWRCARAFGALISMRDASLHANIPDKLPVDDSFHVAELKKAQTRLKTLKKTSLDVAEARAKRDYAAALKAKKEHIKRVSDVRARLDAMREQVDSWQPPSKEHEGLKTFMLQQLDETIKYDGTVSEYYDKVKPQTGEEWLEMALGHAQRDIEYHTQHLAEDRKRADEHQQWIDQLRANIPYTPPTAV
jgi:chromosome segregation ATPase